MTELGPRARKTLWALLHVALAAVVLWLAARLVRGADWSELGRRIRSADALLVGLGALLLVVRYAAWEARWLQAFRASRQELPGTLHGFLTLLASVAVNHVTPTARLFGGLLRARYLGREGERGRTYGVILFDQVVYQAVLVGATVLCGVAWGLRTGRTEVAGALAMLVLVSGALGLRWARRTSSAERTGRLERFLRERAESAGGTVRRLWSSGGDAAAVFRELVARPVLRRRVVALAAVFVLLNGAAQWALFHAVGRPVGFLVPLIGVVLGIGVGALSGSPGGFGTTEAGMVLVYSSLGLDEVDAVAGTVLFRGLHYGIVLGLGLPSLLVVEIRHRRGPGGRPTSGPDQRQ